MRLDMENKAWCYSNRYISIRMYIFGFSDCNYYGELDDLSHIFVTCRILLGLFQLTQRLIRKLTPTLE